MASNLVERVSIHKNKTHHQYHVMAAVGQPLQLDPLLAISCGLTRAHNGHVTLLSVTPDGKKPAWLDAPEVFDGVPVSVQIRLGQKASGAILATVTESPPDLLLLGWAGEPSRGQYLLGSTLDPIIRQAPCDIAVTRITAPDTSPPQDSNHLSKALSGARRVLVPMAGGPNAVLAVQLALGLSPDVEVTALNIARISQGRAGIQLGREQLAVALVPWADNERVRPKVVQAPGIIGGILNEARAGYDLLLIGASNESYIDRMLFGNVPQTVVLSCPIPTIVVKRRVGLMDNWLRRARQRLSHATPRLTVSERVSAYRAIRRGARPDADFFMMIGLSAAIAALGLLLNSPAVIIGAMLVAPLMAAFFGLGMGVVQGDLRLLRLSASATIRGMVLATLVGALMGWIVPGATATPEVMSRTNPTLLDLGVALVSGIAGAYALCRKDVSTSLPGVAIAAALVPPLASVGIGLALRDGRIAGGALLLFITNLISISAAAGLVFLAMGFRPELGVHSRARVFRWGVLSTMVLLLTVSAPLGLLTVQTLRRASLDRSIQHVLEQEVIIMGEVELADWQITGDSDTAYHDDNAPLQLEVQVRATRRIYHQEVIDLQSRVATTLQRPVALLLTIIPITQLDPVAPPTLTPTPTPGPTETPTATPTSVLATPTHTVVPATPTHTVVPATPTHTAVPATPTHTVVPATPTHTAVPATPTPVPAIIQNTDGLGVRLRWTPNGQTAGVLSEGAQVEILYEHHMVDDVKWVLIRDQHGRVGWVALRYLEPVEMPANLE